MKKWAESAESAAGDSFLNSASISKSLYYTHTRSETSLVSKSPVKMIIFFSTRDLRA